MGRGLGRGSWSRLAPHADPETHRVLGAYPALGSPRLLLDLRDAGGEAVLRAEYEGGDDGLAGGVHESRNLLMALIAMRRALSIPSYLP